MSIIDYGRELARQSKNFDTAAIIGGWPHPSPHVSSQLGFYKGLKAWPQDVTPEIAAQWRKDRNFPRQRKIKKQNVDRLAREMSSSYFLTGTQIFFCRLEDGSAVYIVNGNHTLEAIVASGVTLTLTITELKVKDIDEAGRAYAVLDSQSARSWGDALRATGYGDGVPLPTKVLAAMTVIQDSFVLATPGKGSKIARTKAVGTYAAEATVFHDMLKGCDKEIYGLICRAPIMAVVLETLRHQPSAAIEFWTAFISDDGLAKNSPQKRLLSWIRSHPATGKMARIDSALAAAAAWNAFWKEETRDVLRLSKEFILLGTPWKVRVPT